MEFKLLVLEDGEDVFAFDELPDDTRKTLGDRVVEHTFTLKRPTHALKQEAERAMWKADPLLGMVYDEASRAEAECIAYLESWTLKTTLSAEGFRSLHPVLADAIHLRVRAKVYPVATMSRFTKPS